MGRTFSCIDSWHLYTKNAKGVIDFLTEFFCSSVPYFRDTHTNCCPSFTVTISAGFLLFSFVQALGKWPLGSRSYNKAWQKTLMMAAKEKNVSIYMWLLVKTEGTWGCVQSTSSSCLSHCLNFCSDERWEKGGGGKCGGSPRSCSTVVWRWGPAGATQTRDRRRTMAADTNIYCILQDFNAGF